MRMTFYEKLIISIVLFIGVVIATGAIIGNYVATVDIINAEKEKNLVLD